MNSNSYYEEDSLLISRLKENAKKMHGQEEKEFALSIPDKNERERSSSNDWGDKTPEMDGQMKTMSLVMLAKSP